MFARDKTWLERQPGMAPWKKGCAMVSETLDAWLAEYSECVCDQVITRKHDAHSVYADRLWGCWSHHWHQAAEKTPGGRIDGEEVARQIRAGRGWLRGGRLGGDPLRDVVLAVAMPRKDERAVECFQAEYFDFLRRLAGRRRQCFYQEPDPWWNDFLDFLAGYTTSAPKLDRFQGRCALRNWLGTVLWNFLGRWDGAPAEGMQTIEDGRVGHQPEPRVDDLEPCLELFAGLVRQALDELPKQDRLVLCLLYVEGLQLKEVARIVGKHPGNAGKQRDKALARLRERLLELAAERSQEQIYGECLEALDIAPRDFGDAVYEALRESHEEEAGQ